MLVRTKPSLEQSVMLSQMADAMIIIFGSVSQLDILESYKLHIQLLL
jgi:hypothetical protein